MATPTITIIDSQGLMNAATMSFSKTGLTVNDDVFVFYGIQEGSGTPTFDSDFTQLTGSPYNSPLTNANDTREEVTLFDGVVSSTSGTYDFTAGTALFRVSTGFLFKVDGLDVKGDFAKTDFMNTEANPTSPSVSATASDALLVIALHTRGAFDGGATVPTGFTDHGIVTAAGTRQQSLWLASKALTSSGSTGTFTWNNVGTNGVKMGMSFIMEPPVAGGVTVDVPVGALTLNGQVPTIIATDDQTVQIPVGALNLNGFAPTATLTDNQLVNIPTGVLNLNGFAPFIDLGDQTVQIPSGALNLTGFAPTIIGQLWTKQADSVTSWSEQADETTTWTKQ
ncbi:MAG: hypothetical protein ACR2MX_01615 [Cyclobacteriaceae bacterium]